MSNVAALLKNRQLSVSDGAYLERADDNELALEEYLRALVARVPRFSIHRRRSRAMVAKANALEAEISGMDNDGLAEALRATGVEMRRRGFADDLLARAFAIIREGSKRTLGLRHHDVQLVGGWALLQGTIAEMETGEGKTLVATLAACAAAAAGASVHVVTVNDYLAARDAQQNGPLYEFFGLRVGVIGQELKPNERRVQYGSDIVYVSNKEVVFDYLKDRIAGGSVTASQHLLRRLYRADRPPELLLRGLHVAIVDEADSVLIDEARTPLIISETKPDEHGADLYHAAIEIAQRMQRGEHFDVTSHHEIWVLPKGRQLIDEQSQGRGGVWGSSAWRHELIEKALSALWCFHKDQHYIIADGKVQIVDEFSGRVMPDRSWERGLHQMIEAKEQCEITGQRSTLSRITYQRFFRRYLLLCGMTGTAAEVKGELRRVYDLDVIRIPTHRPSRRRYLPNRVWPSDTGRWDAVAQRAMDLSRAGRAVLIGTRSVDASERLSARLSALAVDHTVLNARQDKEEADIVAQAGQPGRITVATNMAGRGTDIRLDKSVSDQGGLHVILTEFHESARVDRQLFGRCARQGEAGSVEALVSFEDDVFKRYAPALTRLATALSLRLGRLPPIILHLLVRYTQIIAEFHNARIRFATLKQDRKLQRMLSFSGKPN